MMTNCIVSNREVVRQYDRVCVYDFGMDLRPMKLVAHPQPAHLKNTKRGKITQFSTASARRLRETLLTRYVPNTSVYGVTLTLPLEHGDWEHSTDYWAAFWNQVQINFRRRLPNVGIVWRIELQKRGVPHIHAVVYTPADQTNRTHIEITNIWCLASIKLAEKLGGVGIKSLSYCIDWTTLVGDRIGYYRYLVDHATKHKQEQLGYQGRQWGVINAKLFEEKEVEETLHFDNDGHRIRFIRAFGRFNRIPVCKFVDGKRVVLKYRRSYRSYGLSAVRGGAESIRRLWENARIPAPSKAVKAAFPGPQSEAANSDSPDLQGEAFPAQS